MKRYAFAALCLIAVVGTAVPTNGNQEPEKKHPIDVWLDAQMEKYGSTHGMRRATREAMVKWEAEMKRNLAKLRVKLSATQKKALDKSQMAWTAFRKAEDAAIIEIVAKQDGTMWPLMAEGQMMGTVKARALDLAGLRKSIESL
jgi:uncharacterized protein YecT (DUF1311 family)